MVEELRSHRTHSVAKKKKKSPNPKHNYFKKIMKLLQIMHILTGYIILPIKIRVSTCEYVTLHNKMGFACVSMVTSLKKEDHLALFKQVQNNHKSLRNQRKLSS